MPPRPPLVTPRLLLVPQTREAAQALVNGADPGLVLGAGYPHADTLDGLRMASAAGEDSGGWFIALRGDVGQGSAQGAWESGGEAPTGDEAAIGPVIGDCGTKGWVDHLGCVEVGYGLAAPWRGRGYGSEAVGALVGWLSAQPEVNTIAAEVEIGNLASRRLLERLGFLVTRTEGSLWQLELRFLESQR